MKANFDISLPSIPGKSIKFKIQDIKSASFGTQRARFNDDKSKLVKKFVESFSNLQQPAPPSQKDETSTQAPSQMSRSQVSYDHENRNRETRFRSMIPENKKCWLPLYRQLQRKDKEKDAEEQTQIWSQVPGYSFSRHEDGRSETHPLAKHQAPLTENYYFSEPAKEPKEETEQRRAQKSRPSAVFRNETRDRVHRRLTSSAIPGPGSYQTDRPSSHKKEKKSAKKGQNAKKSMDFNRMKGLISKVIQQEPQPLEQTIEAKQKKPDHMFADDDRDRFGKHKFPIAPALNTPGPGTYELKGTVEDRVNKILIVEEQRKMLKEWFNN